MEKYKALIIELKKLAKEANTFFARIILSFLVCRLFHGASLDNFRAL